jgi:Tol biopolymer transport system component
MNSTLQLPSPTIVAQTMTPMPTATVIPTQTAPVPESTSTATSEHTLTPLPIQVLDGLRLAYTIDGNLYVQDSGKQAIQLTHSGQDRNPVFSDDGQKIAFFRAWETEMNQLHVINADETGGRAMVTSELLMGLGLGYSEFSEPHSVAFVPGTHLLLVNTNHFSVNYPKSDSSHGNPSNDLLLVDTETGEIKQLAAIEQGGYFLASPNGKWVAVQTPDHVDVIDLQGRVILRDLFNHSPDAYDCVYYGYICAPMYWKQDSSELILVQPRDAEGGGPLPRTLWQYPLDGRPGKEIPLMPGPMGDTLSVSPDGNWIAFSLFDTGDQDGVYLGNLRDGTSRRIYPPESSETPEVRVPSSLHFYGWSADSRHFVFEDGYDTIMGNIQGDTAVVGRGGICGWIDTNRYLDGCGVLAEVGKQVRVRVIEWPSSIDHPERPIAFVFLGH